MRSKPSQLEKYAIADAIGFNIEGNTIKGLTGLVLPNGLTLNLAMAFSHMAVGDDYAVLCYKVAGNLYVAIGVEDQVVTVILLDKSKLQAKTNLASFIDEAHTKKLLGNLDAYLSVVKHMAIDAWFRNGNTGAFLPTGPIDQLV